ncbi:Sin3 associated protein (SAP18) protein (macronuclear) [Tetrahymena thermophila SB210]|uniref:Sin3 associated protein (SAP18) protein n=1 Tax=Tetrahymena thermophila (strain SB210) TaxID=312017 RepID=I7MMH3_TETTS|nr:Sin3 associated protein (SAP18) protein [Tetrahymena thermophila SB210]EAS04856.2 Sin3 associated protein (SAP18) protein [Tetrahymena thermophila SB210]|eukprot:XP_001025101.2 Sin3 associated protein (SAP18) protein [Tetrahymena thermophila SB210]
MKQQRMQQQHQVNRNEVCPFLIRVFPVENNSLDLKYFEDGTALKKYNSINVYAWKDDTLRNIIELSRSQIKIPSDVKNLRFYLNSIYQDPKNNKWVTKKLGMIYDQDLSSKDRKDEQQTLANFQFMIGDYIEIQIEYDSHNRKY